MSHRHHHSQPIQKQRGAALMVMLIILVMGAATMFVVSLNSSALQIARDKTTAAALAQAKDALIGYAVSQTPVTSAGYLKLPDLGPGMNPDGNASSSFSGNNKDYSVIGKMPWKTLGISASRDGSGECLWYAVSGRFKNTPQTSALNWDTQGQIDVIDGNGNVIASNIAALVVAPGQPLDGQGHALSDPAYTQCGGNYDARNYLDSYNPADAIVGEVNYFTGSTNNRVALNTNNKRFVMANNDHYNDRFLFVTTDEIFRPIIRRSDFSNQISALMNDPYFLTAVPTSTNKGINNICGSLLPSNLKFCNNWKEMLLFTTLPTPSSITVNGVPTTACTSVLIFGGQKTAAQVRLTATDKTDPANYLEGTNSAAFATPTATASNFSGNSIFNHSSPSADLLRCLP
jgi:hypothetical protein